MDPALSSPSIMAVPRDSEREINPHRALMKKLVIPPAGPPGPTPGDASATEPPKSQPERTLSMDPNVLPLPPTAAEESDEERKTEK